MVGSGKNIKQHELIHAMRIGSGKFVHPTMMMREGGGITSIPLVLTKPPLILVSREYVRVGKAALCTDAAPILRCKTINDLSSSHDSSTPEFMLR